MTTVVVLVSGMQNAAQWTADLAAVGIEVLGTVDDCNKLVQEVARCRPDLVICDDPLPNERLFKATQAIADTLPTPVLVFTTDSDAERIVQSTEMGVHAYVVNGYGASRLRPLIHLAQARFKREKALQDALQEVSTRFEERKMVDRAKGILMRARQVSDEDAFQILRTASMHSNQRMGQVSQYIIHSARFAEGVNRSGQLRMLSQRLVKLYLLQLVQRVDGQTPQQSAQWKESILRIDDNLVQLQKSLSQPTFGDLLTQVSITWKRLKQVVQSAPQVQQIGLVDGLAEQLLQGAERLTTSLENAGTAAPLHVLNVAGRQRMLSQQFAKHALLGALCDSSARPAHLDGMAQAQAALEQGLRYLNGIPLSTPEIRTGLDGAALHWTQTLAGAADAQHPAGQKRLAQASESLLEAFEHLTAQYERSMQMLVG